MHSNGLDFKLRFQLIDLGGEDNNLYSKENSKRYCFDFQIGHVHHDYFPKKIGVPKFFFLGSNQRSGFLFQAYFDWRTSTTCHPSF